jgi:hypothetical protein
MRGYVRVTGIGRLGVHKAFLSTRYTKNVLAGHLKNTICEKRAREIRVIEREEREETRR